MQLSWFLLMPVWGIRETSDSLQILARPKKEEAGWHRSGVEARGWWPAGWRWAGYHCPLRSGLFCLFDWPERPSRRLMLEGLKGSQKMIKTKSGVTLWFSFHPNSLKPVGTPNRGRTPFPVPGQDGSEMTHAAPFIWGPVLPSVCSPLAFIWRRGRQLQTQDPSEQIRSAPGKDPFHPSTKPWILGRLPHVLQGLRVKARGSSRPHRKLCAHLAPWGPPIPFHS